MHTIRSKHLELNKAPSHGSKNYKVFCHDDKSVLVASFVEFMKLFSDKSALILKTTALIVNPVHKVLLNFSSFRPSRLKADGNTVVVFVPVGNLESLGRFVGDELTSIPVFTSSSTVEVESFVPLTSNASDMYRKMKMLHKAQKMVLEPLDWYTLSGSSAT